MTRMSSNRGPVDDETLPVVLSGSFRRAPDLLAAEYTALQNADCTILSPRNVEIADEREGFVFMEGEENLSPQEIEQRHLEAIQRAAFVWFHAPDGYIGLSGAFEVGYALANGVPVYSDTTVNDETLQHFIHSVAGPDEARSQVLSDPVQIPPALRSMQAYYDRVTKRRGHDDEDAFECLEFLKEELAELEAALLADQEQRSTHGPQAHAHARNELADMVLYIVHMANILDLDLQETVRQKENINRDRFSPDHYEQ